MNVKMGNSTSRSGTQDPEVTPFFFEKSSARRTPKRYKKTPDELPDELKYAHLGPRVAAFLATKEKEKQDGPQDFDDGLGNKSLLPEINKKVSLIRQRLDSYLSSEEDQQRQLVQEACSNALSLLIQLSRVLYLWGGLHPPLPRSLEFNLNSNFNELIGEVYVVPREWQILTNKEEYLTKSLLAKENSHKEDGRNSALSRSTDDDVEKIGRETKDSDSRMSRSKSKIMSRASTLADISEGEESRRKDLSRPVSRQATDGFSRSFSKRDLFNGKDKSETPKPKTRLEKYKSGMNLTDSKTGAAFNVKIISTSSRTIEPRKGGRNLDSALGDSGIDNSKLLGGGAKDAGYWAVINFQLSSKLCDDMGWIIHPSSKEDPERETLLEWATVRLQQAMKQKKEQAFEAAEQGLDKPTIIRNYGDSRREQVEKYKGGGLHSAYSIRNNPVYKGDKPSMPSLELAKNKNKKLFIVTTSDGSTTVFYPSGLPAIVTCRIGGTPKAPTFYTMVYDNTPQQNMLALFTPSGHCCCYYSNGKVRFLADKEGGTLADAEGVIQKRWTWPNLNQKLPVSIVFQLNSSITLRCLNINQIQLVYNHEKENTKVHVGILNLEQEPPSREDMGHLVTGLNFSSQAAKEFSKPYRPKATSQKSKTKSVRGKLALIATGKSKGIDDKNTSIFNAVASDLQSNNNTVRLRPLSKCIIRVPRPQSSQPWEKVQPISSALDTVVKESKDKKSTRLIKYFRDGKSAVDKTDPKDDDKVKPDLVKVVQDQFGHYGEDLKLKAKKQSFDKAFAEMKKKLPAISKSLGNVKKSGETSSSGGKLLSKSLSVVPSISASNMVTEQWQRRSVPNIKVGETEVLKSQSNESVDQAVSSRSDSLKQIQQLLPSEDTKNKRPSSAKLRFVIGDKVLPAGGSQHAMHGDALSLSYPLMFLKRNVPSPNNDFKEQRAAAKAELDKLLEFTEPTENDAEADKELYKLQRKVKNLVEDWLEHYRMAVGIASPYLKSISDGPTKRIRNVRSAKAGGGIVIIEKESTIIPRAKVSYRAPSAPVARWSQRPRTSSTVTSERPTLEHRESCVKFDENPQEIELETFSVARSTTLGAESSVGSAVSYSSRVQSAPQTMPGTSLQSADMNPSIVLCPVALRMALLGHQRVLCRCSRHKVPFITDLELDEFIKKHAPEKQLIVVAVTSSLSNREHPAEDLLEMLYDEKHRNRSRPCMQSRNDPFRIFWYDLATAAELSDHAQPLLLRRHNVVMGMFLIYESGNLLFCDHIFNGYGNARKDFHKQLQNSRRAASNHQILPQDFKFSPQKGRTGLRAAWGGEIGGLAGHKERFIAKGGEGEPRRGSDSSLSSGNSKDLPIDYQISGVNFSMNKVISKSLTEAAITDRQSPRPPYSLIRPMSQPVQETLSDLSQTGTPQLERSHSQMAALVHLPEIKSSA